MWVAVTMGGGCRGDDDDGGDGVAVVYDDGVAAAVAAGGGGKKREDDLQLIEYGGMFKGNLKLRGRFYFIHRSDLKMKITEDQAIMDHLGISGFLVIIN
ncbi:hypothetical protein Tco_0845463 [Tanacetum coccineum]